MPMAYQYSDLTIKQRKPMQGPRLSRLEATHLEWMMASPTSMPGLKNRRSGRVVGTGSSAITCRMLLQIIPIARSMIWTEEGLLYAMQRQTTYPHDCQQTVQCSRVACQRGQDNPAPRVGRSDFCQSLHSICHRITGIQLPLEIGKHSPWLDC